ncbi:hypothetical protein Tco_0773013 [Tanacetum coccineum]|uniref:Uncharacterized protein n=1 Tax=Tanacetum coccineum TaxID=301880 RepID=A0ABQ4ZKJ2_9ASTR
MVSASKDPLTFNDLMATPIDFSKYVFNGLKIENLTQDILLGPASIYKLNWNNPEGDRYPFDLSNPLPLQGPPGHRTVAADYFFNNDLEYLKTSDPEVTYTTSITKIKVARYEIKGIEDMVPTLWSTIKHAYDKDALMGIKHWGERRKLWYRSQSVSVKKLHGYGHLEEIVGKRSDEQLYTFKEGDFVDLHLNDIEDMLLLAVQHKLFYLDRNIIVDFIVALQPYTPSYDPPGIVYEDLNKQKRVLRADKLYKFSDDTLKSVHDEIYHIVLDFRLDYNTEMPKRKWRVVDQKRSGLIIELIDKQLREREIIKKLERLVSARELEMDYKLMTHTKTCNNDKNLSEIQLEHEKEDGSVVVVVKVVHECESFSEGGDDFGVDVLRFHTCLTDILGFLEKLEWWFEQDIDDEEEEDEEGEGGSEV